MFTASMRRCIAEIVGFCARVPAVPDRRRVMAMAAAAILAGCAAGPMRSGEPAGAAIHDIAGARWLTLGQLADRLASVPVVLLGELHDSAHHHAAQLEILNALIARGRRPALAMEQFDIEHQAALDAARGRMPPVDAEALADAGRFNRQGWDWPQYRPLIDVAIAHRLPLHAANLARDDARRVMAQGFGALGPARAAALGLPPGFDAEIRDALAAEVVASHCGMVGADKAGPMVRAQQARDAVMAEVIRRRPPDGSVLIAGNGHVRRDRGVPRYLNDLKPGQIAVVGFAEAQTTAEREQAVAAVRGRYDFVWITPPTPRGDPCAPFRKPAAERAPSSSNEAPAAIAGTRARPG